MKPKRKDIKAKTRCQPVIRFEEQRLTSFSGMILFNEIFLAIDMKKKLTSCFSHIKRTSLYGFGTLCLVTLVHIILGWKRLRDISYYEPMLFAKQPENNKCVACTEVRKTINKRWHETPFPPSFRGLSPHLELSC